MQITSPRFENQDFLMPAADALLVATLALMTGHAQSQNPCQQSAMAERIAEHLRQMERGKEVSPALRPALRELQVHWQRLSLPMATGWREPCQWQTMPSQLQ